MKVISNNDIKKLGISASMCTEWVKESFALKEKSILPPKVSIHPRGIDFFTTMPCVINTNQDTQYFGCKIIHRLTGVVPSLGSDLLLYDAVSCTLLAMLDSDWITAMRTGAVASLATKTFKKRNTEKYGFVGLGNTARATLLCLLETEPDIIHKVILLQYKNQSDLFIERFREYSNVVFMVADSIEEMVASSDVIISCITETESLVCPDTDLFKKGCLVVPVHTRGFQNCDLFFDKVFADDTEHVKNFKYFDKFNKFAEFGDVLCGKCRGRESEDERILSYNVGLGLHDVFFAIKIYQLLKDSAEDVLVEHEQKKYWV